MNELIEKFAEQCTTSCIDGRGVELNEIDVAKFAQLIIKECQMQTVITACSLELDANPFVDQITKHFGVEE